MPDVMLLAVVQGLTEFLPVSSSGHLVAVRHFLRIADVQGTAFDAFLHLGTLAAVLVYYWRVWWGVTRGVFVHDGEGRDKQHLAAKLALATVPGAVVGYFLQGEIADQLRTPGIVATGLLVTAGLLLLGDFLYVSAQKKHRAAYQDAMVIGLAQMFALLPGLSRSGTTIAVGRSRGLSRQQATNFSFLMSAPIIAGAGLSSLASLIASGGFNTAEMVVGFGVSFLSGLAAIHILLKLIERISFVPFAIYLVALAAALMMW